jgi:hypothetical protein
MRGLVGEIDGDGEDQLGIELEEVPLVEGDPCPTCGAPLVALWLSRQTLYGPCDGGESGDGPLWRIPKRAAPP